MWICPKCGHKFYNRNQAHSCGEYSVEKFLQGKTEVSVKLFEAFLKKYSTVGSFELHPVKTRVALLTKMRFASVNRLAADHLDGHLVLTQHFKDSVFYKTDNLKNRFFVHHFRLYKASDISGKLYKYMKLAYKTGQREHVKKGD